MKLVFKNFPIRSHSYAVKAAQAALAAQRQGKFWEFHNELFKFYNSLNDQKIREIARQLGLDESALEQQQNNPVIADQIRRDYEEGLRLGIRGVPSVFINGKILRELSMQKMEAEIEKELNNPPAKGNNTSAQ
jgi:protein-disulfide isomerase